MLDRTTETAPKETTVAARVTQPSPDASGSSLLALQRQAGNQAVVGLLAEQPIQPQLLVGAVNDPAEAEADRMADRVLRTLLAAGAPDEPEAPEQPAAPVARVRRRLRRTAASDAPGHGLDGGPVDEGVARGIQQARGGGAPLDPVTRTEMESGFGADFSDIRIHTGSRASTLSRSLNAEAFTTGADVFFRGTPEPRVLAHELAHTIQQGAATVRRFVTPWDFAEMTDQGTFTQKSTAQKRIEEYLAKYYELTGKDSLRPEEYVRPPIEDTKYLKALLQLDLMDVTVKAWLSAHAKENEDGTRTLDKNRETRGKGMLRFEAEVAKERARIEELKKRKASVGKGGPEQEAVSESEQQLADLAKESIKAHYKGSLTESFSLATTIVGKLLVNDGDSTDFELAVTVPISGPVYVGVTLRFNGRKQGNISLSMEALVTAGAKATGVGDIQAALGGFVRAAGKDPNGAVNLVKYGLYRRLRESSAVPREIANKLWGGDTGEAGYEQGEKWSKAVEKEELEAPGSYAETGGQAEGNAKLGGDKAGGALGAKYQSGSRYDKEALTKSKDGLGADNSGGIVGRGAQNKIGRSVTNTRFSGALSLGPFRGELLWTMSYRDDGTSTDEVLEAFEIRANARASMPIGDVDTRLVSVVGSFITTSKGLVAKFHRTAESDAQKKALAESKTAKGVAKGLVVPTLLLANASANAAFTAAEGVTWSQWAQGISREQAAAAAARPGGPPTLSKVGLEIGLTFSMDGDTEIGLVELRHVSDLSAQLPELLKVQLLKKTRLGGAKWNGSSWAPVL